ncbi:MAG: hypothetical protein OHK93_004216 [Ramalina farinacea]|uniref:Uncharacterized protein n=1 Tax=Ramalina farinacea TaxID=258253 RepID=A0AA43QGC1_9LECA|nr:hypothetical protein [Ramalina farinacea]
MVKVKHKGYTVGHTFISIDYKLWDPLSRFFDQISTALKAPDGSNMPRTPAVSHRIKTVWVDWQGAFGPNDTLTELTPTNCRAVFQYMAGARHPYNLEVVFGDGEELPPYSSLEEGDRSMKKDGYVTFRDNKKPL